MTRFDERYASALQAAFATALVDLLVSYMQRPGPLALTTADFADVDVGPEETIALLQRVALDGYLQAETRSRCAACQHDLLDENIENYECANCRTDLSETPGIEYTVFTRTGTPSRDARWVIAVHGMNTHGAWQEDFSWRLAKLYGYAVPVFIYKYGRILFSPILILRQRRCRDHLAQRISGLRAEMNERGYGDRPDVIAHSFGTWLLAHALLADPSIQLGRVILTGAILRPDFDWTALVDSGRVEAVLCHYGRRDKPVRVSQFVIPESGPSGHRGFSDSESVVHVVEPSFGHGHYFIQKNIDDVMQRVWSPFLTLPQQDIKSIARIHDGYARTWRPSWWQWISHPAKYVLLVCLFGMAVLCCVALILGLRGIWLALF